MTKVSSKAEIYALAMGLLGLFAVTLVWQINWGFAYGLTGHGIIRRTGTIDFLAALLWLAASIVCIYRIATVPQDNKVLLFFWAIFSFLCAGEEIKWGYRIFHYSLAAIQNMNYQGDVSIHNLNFTTRFAISPKRLFLIGFFIYFFIIPLIIKLKYFNKLKRKFNYIAPSFYFIVATWVPIFLSYIIGHIIEKGKPWQFIMESIQSQTREWCYALVVLVYVVLYLGVENNASNEQAAILKSTR